MKQTDNMTPITGEPKEAGFIVPLLGRKAMRDVSGFPGFFLIRRGETITREIINRAQHMGRLFELTAATEVL